MVCDEKEICRKRTAGQLLQLPHLQILSKPKKARDVSQKDPTQPKKKNRKKGLNVWLPKKQLKNSRMMMLNKTIIV